MTENRIMDEFMKMVADMRSAQKEYFRTRSQVALAESRRLEKAVDNAIRRMAEEDGK